MNSTHIKLFYVHIDEKLFALSKSTLLNCEGTYLHKILTKEVTDKYVFFNQNHVYVDRDPESFSFIVNILRGYDVKVDEIADSKLRNKVMKDLEYFGINSVSKVIESVNQGGEEPEYFGINSVNKVIESVNQGGEEPEYFGINSVNKVIESVNQSGGEPEYFDINSEGGDGNSEKYEEIYENNNIDDLPLFNKLIQLINKQTASRSNDTSECISQMEPIESEGGYNINYLVNQYTDSMLDKVDEDLELSLNELSTNAKL